MAVMAKSVAIISYFFISNINTMEIKYINNRDIEEGNNFFANFRPSGLIRIIKYPLEYSIFQSALTYGIMYNGFGIHSYYLQKTGSKMGFGPWGRFTTITTTFSKCLAVALPFFYSKEVFVSLLYISTREKPQLRKTLDFSFVHNAFAFATTFPFFYFFQRNLNRSLRGCLVLTLFSMVNDIFIETKRKQLMQKGISYEEIVEHRVKKNVESLKKMIDSQVTNPNIKKQLAGFNWDKLSDDVLIGRRNENNSEQVRTQQMKQIASELRQSFKSLHQIFN